MAWTSDLKFPPLYSASSERPPIVSAGDAERALSIGTRSAQSIRASGHTCRVKGRARDRTRPMLQKRQKVGKEGRPEPIIAKISQETLAEMIGTTRSRVSHFMNKFRQLGFIDYNGTMEVHSSLLSVVLHDQPQIKT
jgi:CRP-like cAMP-binding protein